MESTRPSNGPQQNAVLDAEEDQRDETKRSDLISVKGVLAARPQLPYLVVVAGTGVGEMFRLEGDEAIVGRGEKAQFRIFDDAISRYHARLFREGDALYLEDLKSVNGTAINGERITRRELNDGDKISVGSTTILKFTYHDRIDVAFQQKMYEAALRDGLTRLYNKRFMLDRLLTEVAFCRRHQSELTLLMLDVDHFKAVNDTYGHVAGDAVIVKVADLLQRGMRTEDVVARYGGEEFAIICRNTDLAAATVIGERVRQAVADNPLVWQGQKISVTISVGIGSAAEDPGGNVLTLIAAADKALYVAKRSGRNRVCTQHDPDGG